MLNGQLDTIVDPANAGHPERAHVVGDTASERMLDLSRLIEYIEVAEPRLYAFLDQDRIHDHEYLRTHLSIIRSLTGHAEFDDDASGGRGSTYRAHQLKRPLARKYGDEAVLREITKSPNGLSYRSAGVDVIGGNGTFARVTGLMKPLHERPYTIAADPCLDMVEDTLRQGFPALPQAAQSMLFRDGSLDYVLGTRGLHHVDRTDRQSAVNEAARVLKPGGRIVLIDPEEGSPTARFYSEGLDRYTHTGHRFVHFTPSELTELLTNAGFIDVMVRPLYDPFVVDAEEPLAARRELLEHIVGMFGMVRLAREPNETACAFVDRLDAALSPFARFGADEVGFDPNGLPRLTVYHDGTRWKAEYPRVALVATAAKPSNGEH